MLTTQASLLERLRHVDDEAAWARFVELYAPLLFEWCRRYRVADAEAPDVVQDVMTLLVQKMGRFNYDSSRRFRAWLRTVFLNKVRERARKKTIAVATADVETIANPETDDEEDREDRRLLVRQGLELIRPEFSGQVWRAFWEYVMVGRPASEVATEMSLAIGTIYAAKCRVLNRLRLEVDFAFDE